MWFNFFKVCLFNFVDFFSKFMFFVLYYFGCGFFYCKNNVKIIICFKIENIFMFVRFYLMFF